MAISGGEIGFDEGGVLQALFSRPVWQQETEHWKYNKQGLVTKHWTTKVDVSMGDALIPLVIAGVITLGGLFAHRLSGAASDLGGLTDPAGIPVLQNYTSLYGYLIGPLLYARAMREYYANKGLTPDGKMLK